MGCDIHICTEQKLHTGLWTNVDSWVINPYFDPMEDDSGESPMSRRDIYRGRNYELFGTLCGVRNDELPRISDPRGIPKDAHPMTMGDFANWGDDGHSASWVTLKELKDFDEAGDGTVERTGMISPEQIAELGQDIKPDHWCGGTNQPGYEEHTWTDDSRPLQDLLDQIQKWQDLNMWAHEAATMNPNDFRLVFWFDN